MSTTPSIQLLRPSARVWFTIRTEKKSTTASNGSNSIVIGLEMHHASSCTTGITNMATWIEEPTATAMERSAR